MPVSVDKAKIILIAVMVGAISFAHYTTELKAHHYHLLYQGLYFIPVVLSGFWFGLRGGLATSLSITFIYLPFTIMMWAGFSSGDLNSVIEMILYNFVAFILGTLKDRELREQKRARDAESLAAMGKALSGVAHDMKTPLMAIGGFAGQVAKKLGAIQSCPENFPVLLKEIESKLAIVAEETRRLESMVKDMLDFSRPLELHRLGVDLNHLIKECLPVVEDIAQKREVPVLDDLSEKPVNVSCDAMRMKQVIINLLTNAIHVSPVGEPVRISSRIENGTFTIEVADHGPGIPEEKREEVFLPFVTFKKEGTGLGLSIVKKIVEAHEGRVEILDNAEGGLTFRVSVPKD